MTIRIINADVMDGLRQLEDESVHCVVTSPPYWGLRDYGVDGQIGLEATPEAFVAKMVDVFREVRRVLRKDGTCWVNLGDSYASTPSGAMRSSGLDGGTATQQAFRLATASKTVPAGLKHKDLIGIPWRVAFALQADGWWLRSDIIWAKPNPMPESVTDRPTKAHEYVFLLAKSERYYYDAEAIKEACSPTSHGSPNVNVGWKNTAINDPKGPLGKWTAEDKENGRNKRTVWTVATSPFAEAHFATFPPDLIEPMIKAGCPVGGTVLDPFSGAGTTCLVADRLQRNGIGVELNPEYAAMSERRIRGDAGMFAQLEVTS